MFLTSAKCSKCKTSFSPDSVLTVCPKCGGVLLFEYDLPRVSEVVSKQVLKNGEDTFWKFIKLLPILSEQNIVSLGEPYTPVMLLSGAPRLKNVYVKDDGRLPTGTFKARGMAVAVSALKELGINSVAIPSAGNAASALAAYGARAGIQVQAFMPKDVPDSILAECIHLGAEIHLVDGLINHAAEIVKNLRERYGWFDISTNKQPYRFEGYKAMAFEMAEQFDWDLPDNVLFPTGGGEGVIGLWKGFNEMTELGWIQKTPRLIAVQSSGCAPLVEAYKNNDSEIRHLWENCETIASGLRVPSPYASYLTLRAVRETKGIAVSVDEKEIVGSMRGFFRHGFYAGPEASSTLAALTSLQDEGELDPGERTLLYLTGSAMKHFDILKAERSMLPILKKGTLSLGERQ